MNRIFTLLGIVLFISANSSADVYVPRYTKGDGTYVASHYRSDPNGSTSKPNINPHTGEEGTKDPYSSSY